MTFVTFLKKTLMKYFLILTPVILLNSATAQTSRGSFLIGGNISYSAEKQKTLIYFFGFNGDGDVEEAIVKARSFAISPTVGYFPVKNLCVGFSFPFSITKAKAKEEGNVDFTYEYESRTSNFGPFARYYIPLQNNFYVLTGAGYGWGYARDSYYYFHSEGAVVTSTRVGSKSKFRRFNVGAGLSYFLNKNMGVELLLAYNSTSYEDNTNKATGLVLVAGLQMYLHK